MSLRKQQEVLNNVKAQIIRLDELLEQEEISRNEQLSQRVLKAKEEFLQLLKVYEKLSVEENEIRFKHLVLSKERNVYYEKLRVIESEV